MTKGIVLCVVGYDSLMAEAYSECFYDEMEESSLASARVVVPMVVSLVGPRSVVDVGCGEGVWLIAFRECGVVDSVGIDGEWVRTDALKISAGSFIPKDLEKPFNLQRTFDLAVCLEVAEHLDASAAGTLVENLTNLAPVILFSAAIPFQGGSHHVNEQWPEYWEELFATRGYVPVDCIRRHIWNDTRVSFFYAQNTLLYVKKADIGAYANIGVEIEKGYGKALPLVHPRMYRYYAERWRMVVPLLGKFPPPLLHAGKRVLRFFKKQ